MAKSKIPKKKSAKPTKIVKKTRKVIVEPFYVFGYVRAYKFIGPIFYKGSTYNNLVRLARLLKSDKTTLWFALDESRDELENWERKIREIAKSSFNNDVEAAVIDFQKLFTNKYKSFLDLINAILKLPKSQINYLLITQIAGNFELAMEEWSLQSFNKP